MCKGVRSRESLKLAISFPNFWKSKSRQRSEPANLQTTKLHRIYHEKCGIYAEQWAAENGFPSSFSKTLFSKRNSTQLALPEIALVKMRGKLMSMHAKLTVIAGPVQRRALLMVQEGSVLIAQIPENCL